MRSKLAVSPDVSTTVRHPPLHDTLAPILMPSTRAWQILIASLMSHRMPNRYPINGASICVGWYGGQVPGT